MTVTEQQVRDHTGITLSEISDSVITRLLSEATEAVELELGVSTNVLEEISVLNGDPYTNPRLRRSGYHNPRHRRGWNSVKVPKNPLLAVRELKSGDDSITVSTLSFSKNGRIHLTDDSEISYFDSHDQKQVRVRYLHGAKEPSKNGSERTKINEASGVSKGTSVVFSVDDASGFSADDHIEISSMSGAREVTKISSISSNELTVDEISFDHDDNAIVAKMINDQQVDQLIKTIAAISVILHDNGKNEGGRASYSLGDQSVTKVRTQHQKSLEGLINEKNRIIDKFATISTIA